MTKQDTTKELIDARDSLRKIERLLRGSQCVAAHSEAVYAITWIDKFLDEKRTERAINGYHGRE